MSTTMFKKIEESANYILEAFNYNPQIGIVLGTGLGGLVNEIKVEKEFLYQDLPHFPLSTVESHTGKLIFGTLAGVKVVAMQGRFHYYEGYDLNEVVFPIRVMKLLGIKKLFISNAAGGINSSFIKGDLMLITDHINQFPGNPLIGKNMDEIGPRFPDMSAPYHQKLLELAQEVAQKNKIKIQKGVYVGLPGPMLETPAEYKYLALIGADAVGMSTVPEVIAAVHAGIPVFACSIITDVCYGEIKPVNISEIIAIAMNAEPKLTTLFKEMIHTFSA